MVNEREFEGKDLEEALHTAAKALGVDEPDLDYKILEQGYSVRLVDRAVPRARRFSAQRLPKELSQGSRGQNPFRQYI